MLYKHIDLEELGQMTTFLGNNINIDYKNKLLYINTGLITCHGFLFLFLLGFLGFLGFLALDSQKP